MKIKIKRPPGRALEIEVAQHLRANGFQVTDNAKVATPRQTDIFARASDVSLLIEVKDRQRKKIDIADIDSVRARLRRTASDIVGVIFTMSPLTSNAIKEIESDRTREILVFVKEEIERIRSGNARLRNLIDRKRQELRVQGRVWFDQTENAEFINAPLPRTVVEFHHKNRVKSYFESKTVFAHAAYAQKIPDTGWGGVGGEGALLSIDLTLSSSDDMRNILGYLHEKFGLSNKGMFSIHQEGVCWHGMGVENLLTTVRDWRRRYINASMKRVHHSEDITYFDELRDGWILLSTRQRVYAGESRDCFLHQSEVAIQLPGIPIDTAPFLDLCRYTGNEWGQFKYINQPLTHTRRLKKSIRLDVVGKIVELFEELSGSSRRDRWVTGLIAQNPFYRKKSLPKELDIENCSALNDLLEMELLLFDLRDHHSDGDIVDFYLLEGFETTEAHRTQIIRPYGTWNQIVKRAKDHE